jgi:hypothetical protein
MIRPVRLNPRIATHENPSGLVIGGLLLALAGAGGAGYYFLVANKKSVEPEATTQEGKSWYRNGHRIPGWADLDQSLVGQLDEEGKQLIHKYFPSIGVMAGLPYTSLVSTKNNTIKKMLQPAVYKYVIGEQGRTVSTKDRTVTREEAKQLVASGKYEWWMIQEGVMPVDKTPEGGAAPAKAAKTAAKKKAKKK